MRANERTLSMLTRLEARMLKGGYWDQTAYNEEMFFLSHGDYKSHQVRGRPGARRARLTAQGATERPGATTGGANVRLPACLRLPAGVRCLDTHCAPAPGVQVSVRVMDIDMFMNSKRLFKDIRHRPTKPPKPVMVHINYHPGAQHTCTCPLCAVLRLQRMSRLAPAAREAQPLHAS